MMQMGNLKEIDYKILYELMKNSKTSDRRLAKKLGVSQPTVTRRRSKLEKEVIEGYTTIPRWEKLGYQILALILVKAKLQFASNETMREAYDSSMEWLKKQPNVILAGQCRGMGFTGFMISVHKTYADFDAFMGEHRRRLGNYLEDVQTVLANMSGPGIARSLHLKYLAETK